MMMRDFRRDRQSSVKACFSLVLWLTVALVPGACRPSLHEIAERAEERVKIDKAGKEETGKGKANSEAPKPMLVIDVTLSMAGYFAPPEQPATEFSKALDVLSGLSQVTTCIRSETVKLGRDCRSSRS